MKKYQGWRLRLSLILITYMICFKTTHASPPFLTGGPEPTEYKHYELYVFATADITKNANNITAPSVALQYGLWPNLEVNFTVPISINLSNKQDTVNAAGLNDLQLGLTYRFIQETQYVPQIGLTPAINLPTGNQGRGLGNGRPWEIFPIWAQKSWGPWTTYGGGGYAHNSAPSMKNYFFFRLAFAT